MTDLRDLFARIAAGPRFLLLGQGSERTQLAGHVSQDKWFFPAEFLADPAGPPSSPATAEDYARYATAVAGTQCPSDLAPVMALNWNGVLTSRVDSSLFEWLQNDWRRLVPTALPQSGRHPRSTTELQIRYLFGGIALPEDERPPTDEVEWIDAERNASDILGLLAASLLTPKGVLLVEGWTLRDWISPTDLFNLASRLGQGQLHLFSTTAEVKDNKFISAAIGRGLITAHDESLSELLEDAADRGVLGELSADAADHTHLIPASEGFASIDIDTWNRVLNSARPVDLELLEPFPVSSGPVTYQRFRSFLGSSEGAPPWRAVASGYKLGRTYEPRLLEQVEAAMSDTEDPGPVILRGQTATGKSLALVWLAQTLARTGRVAVLYQARRRDRPSASDLEAFSEWADGVGALRTVLIWDGMADPEDYFSLHRQLRARGQRVSIVGSSYLGDPAGFRTVTAPIHLDGTEADAVEPWLATYGIKLPPASSGADTSFLALLYRALPETEGGLRRGLALEMRAAESGMEAMSRDKRVEPENRMSAIAQALVAAGFDIDELAPSERPNDELTVLGFSERSLTEQLSAMLLTAGRRGLNLPLELALRVVGREGSNAVVKFMKHFDIFRWTEAEDGGQFLGVRTRLEAELLAREDLSLNTEMEVACTLIRQVRPSATSRTGGDEVQFVVDLLEQIGPQSQDPGRFAPWYGELAGAFSEQRDLSAQEHSRMVLLEANLLREHNQRSQRQGRLTHVERMSLLRRAEELLLRTIENGEGSPRARLNLFVELASAYGSQIYELANSGDSSPDSELVGGLAARLLDAVMHAREADPENIYPVDVLAWSARAAVNSGALSRHDKLSLLADAKASLDSLDPTDLSPRQRAAYNNRQADVAGMLGDPELEHQYLRELLAIDDPAAYYLLATRAAVGGGDGVQIALQTLLDGPKALREDWKCARLILDLFWESKSGKRLLRGDRETVALTSEDWQACLELVSTLHGAAQFDQYRIAFLRGLALFHVGAVTAAQTEFRTLGSLGLDVGRRVHLAYLASDPDGSATEFTGRVAWASPDGHRGRVWVDQLRVEVDFVPLRFSPVDFRSRNEVVPTFHIGFNYRGPVADPIRRAHRPAPPKR